MKTKPLAAEEEKVRQLIERTAPTPTCALQVRAGIDESAAIEYKSQPVTLGRTSRESQTRSAHSLNYDLSRKVRADGQPF